MRFPSVLLLVITPLRAFFFPLCIVFFENRECYAFTTSTSTTGTPFLSLMGPSWHDKRRSSSNSNTISSRSVGSVTATTTLSMAGFGASSSTTTTKTKRSKKTKKQSSNNKNDSSFDVSAAFMRSEKLYDKIMIESTKSILSEEEEEEDNTYSTTSITSDDDTITSEFIVAARRSIKSSSSSSSQKQQQQQSQSPTPTTGSDWIPVAQICLCRSRHSRVEYDGRIPPQLVQAVSALCREIHWAATISARSVFSSVPRKDVEYSVEPVESFYKFVYDVVLDDTSSGSSSASSSEQTTMITTTKEARAVLGVDETCTDINEIKRAYRTLSFKNHPDRFVVASSSSGSSDVSEHEIQKAKAMETYTKVKDAYEMILRSGLTAVGKSSAATTNGGSSSGSGSGLSWYESLGGRERTDFQGPLELIQLKEAQKGFERCLKTENGYRSAIAGLDPEIIMCFVARNQANAVMSR